MAVCFPRSTDEVAYAVQCASAPSAARSSLAGSGTGLAGGATPVDDPLVIVTTRMNRVLEVDVEASGRLGRARASSTSTSAARSPSTACTTRRTRPRSRPARSAGTSPRTRAGRTASPPGSRPRTSWPSTWSSPTAPWPGSVASSPTRRASTSGAASWAARARWASRPASQSGSSRTRRASGRSSSTSSPIDARGRHGERGHRGRHRPVRARDDGRAHHPGGRGLRARRLPPRRRGGAARRARRTARRGRGRGRRSSTAWRVQHGARNVRVAADATRARPALEGPQVGVRRDRPHQARLLPARRSRPAHAAARGAAAGLRDRRGARPASS